MHYDAVVIGGGPAGSSAAFALASAGVPVLLADAAASPGEKACGGSLSGRATALLLQCGILDSAEIASVTLSEHLSMRLFYNCEPLRLHVSGGPPMRMVDRRRFDALLLEKAGLAGASVASRERLVDLSGDEALFRSGRTVRFGCLIGADGAGSRVRRICEGGRALPNGFGIERFLPMPPSFPDEIQIHFGQIPYAYGWVFPRAGEICIGMCSCSPSASPRNLLAALDSLCERVGLAVPRESRAKGGLIPAGRIAGGLGAGRVYLAGDAAGLCDQVSGEGISLAIESGLLAGRAAAGDGRSWLLEVARKGCIRRVRQSRLARHLLFLRPLQGTAMRKLAADDKFCEGFWGMSSGSGDYASMLGGFLRR